jgi:hypothetical protein
MNLGVNDELKAFDPLFADERADDKLPPRPSGTAPAAIGGGADASRPLGMRPSPVLNGLASPAGPVSPSGAVASAPATLPPQKDFLSALAVATPTKLNSPD